MNEYKYFGEFLQQLRQDNQLTQAEAADGVCTLRQYQRLEKGESTPRIDVLFGLSEKFNVNLSDYYYYSFCYMTLKANACLQEVNIAIASHNQERLRELIEQMESIPDYQQRRGYRTKCYAEALVQAWNNDFEKCISTCLTGLNLSSLDDFLNMNTQRIYSRVDYPLINCICCSLAQIKQLKEACIGFSKLRSIIGYRNKQFSFEVYKMTDNSFIYYELATVNLAECYYDLHQYDLAYTYVQDGINFTIKHNNIQSMYNFLELKGRILAAQNKISEAQEVLQQALLITKLHWDSETNEGVQKSYESQYAKISKLLSDLDLPKVAED